jgi:hypothetical protein
MTHTTDRLYDEYLHYVPARSLQHDPALCTGKCPNAARCPIAQGRRVPGNPRPSTPSTHTPSSR